MKYKSFLQFKLPLMIWFLITSLSDPVFTFLLFHLEDTGCPAFYKIHQLLITLLCLLHHALFLQIVALLFSKIYYHEQVIFKCHLLLIYILFNCLNTYYFNLYIYLFDSNIIQFGPWKVNISRSDCSLYCSFIYHTTCNPISSIVHSIKYIYFCTL